MSKHPLSQKGATFIELMITLAIIAVLLGLGMPSYQKLSHRIAIKQLNNRIVQLLTHARISALTHNKTVSVCPIADIERITIGLGCIPWTKLNTENPNNHGGWLVFIDEKKRYYLSSLDDVISVNTFENATGKVGVISINNRGNAIRFSEKGLLTNGGRTIIIGNTNKRLHSAGYDYKIIVAANTGRIRSERIE